MRVFTGPKAEKAQAIADKIATIEGKLNPRMWASIMAVEASITDAQIYLNTFDMKKWDEKSVMDFAWMKIEPRPVARKIFLDKWNSLA